MTTGQSHVSIVTFGMPIANIYLNWFIYIHVFIHRQTTLMYVSYYSVLPKTRSDILQGQALFRGVKQLRRCLVMLNNFEKFSFQSIEKRWTKDKETDGQKEKRQEKTRKEKKREKKKEKEIKEKTTEEKKSKK